MSGLSIMIKPVSGACNMRCADGPVSFAFQGGEPTLDGLPYCLKNMHE